VFRRKLTYDRGTLEDRRTPVEDKDRFYSPEEKLADATQEAKDMGIVDHTPVVVSHCGLELVNPYTGIYREDTSLQSLQAFERKSAKTCKEKCSEGEREIQHWPPDWGEQFPEGLDTHDGWVNIERARIDRATACSDDTILLRDDDDERKPWNVSAVDKPLAHGADTVLDAGPFLFFLLVPLETIKPRCTSEQAASDIDEQPPLATTTPVPSPEDGLSDAATKRVPTPTSAATAPTTTTTATATTIARPAIIYDL